MAVVVLHPRSMPSSKRCFCLSLCTEHALICGTAGWSIVNGNAGAGYDANGLDSLFSWADEGPLCPHRLGLFRFGLGERSMYRNCRCRSPSGVYCPGFSFCWKSHLAIVSRPASEAAKRGTWRGSNARIDTAEGPEQLRVKRSVDGPSIAVLFKVPCPLPSCALAAVGI